MLGDRSNLNQGWTTGGSWAGINALCDLFARRMQHIDTAEDFLRACATD